MPSITEQSAWAEASHVILLISGSDYFRIKAEFMKKSALSQRPGLQNVVVVVVVVVAVVVVVQ